MSEESPSDRRSPRFIHWLAFLVFSAITLGSAVEVANNNNNGNKNQESDERWAVICSAVTFGLSLLVVLLHLSPITALFISGTRIEGAMCIILVAFWAAAVGVISDSKNGLAVDERGAVSNGNLYYFSWAGFVCSITLTVSYLRSAFHVDIAGEIRTRSARLNVWAAHLACSLIVMGSSASIFDNDCAVGSSSEFYRGAKFCRRTKFSLALGAIGTVMALAIVATKIATSKAPFLVEAIFTIILLVCYAFGVAYTTSQKGPGAPLGNLYYFTWGAFLSTFMLAASCSEDYNAAKASAHDHDNDHAHHENEIQIEDLKEAV